MISGLVVSGDIFLRRSTFVNLKIRFNSYIGDIPKKKSGRFIF